MDRGRWDLIAQYSNVQLTPALTDLKGPTIFICYSRISVIANIGIKEKPLKGPENSFCYRRISITGGSVRAGFNCRGIDYFIL